MIAMLSKAMHEGKLDDKLKVFTVPRLLAIDEVGYLNYENRYADLLFEFVTRRYLTSPVLINTNKPFSEWTAVFSSRRLCRHHASSRKRAEPSSTASSIALENVGNPSA